MISIEQSVTLTTLNTHNAMTACERTEDLQAHASDVGEQRRGIAAVRLV